MCLLHTTSYQMFLTFWQWWQTWPSWIYQTTGLIWTIIINCKYSHLPSRLTSVPEPIIQLTGLTHLILTNNFITENDLPKSMSHLNSLRTLNLSGETAISFFQSTFKYLSRKSAGDYTSSATWYNFFKKSLSWSKSNTWGKNI